MRYDVSGSGTEDLSPVHEQKLRIFRTLSYFRPYAASIAGMFICIIATALLNLVWPYLNGTILYDKVLARIRSSWNS